MKLDEKMKKQIDSYFESISADELYDLLTQKYGFPNEVIESSCDISINNQTYDTFENKCFNDFYDVNYAKYNAGKNDYLKQQVENLSSRNGSYTGQSNPLALAA